MNEIKEGDYHFEYQEEPIQEDEQVLNDGISDDAPLKKNMERIKPFRVFIKDAQGVVLGEQAVLFFMVAFMSICSG